MHEPNILGAGSGDAATSARAVNGGGAHAALCDRAVAALEPRFPGAGIGVTGSFATGRHHAASDLDLLLADPAVERDWQLAFRENGVRVNVVCAHPDRFAAQLRRDASAFAAIRASYVLGARPLRDPDGHMAALQAAAREALALRDSDRAGLLARMQRTVADLLARGNGTLDVWTVGALWTAVEAVHLRDGRTALDKRDGNRPFEVLRQHDPALHSLARAALLEGAPARQAVEEMAGRIFGPAPP